MDRSNLGNRQKAYEKEYAGRRIIAGFPICVRIDGRSFSKFTKGLNRPFDVRMSNAMIEVSKYLVEQSHAQVAYTQSDEISLVFHTEDYNSSVFFDGKVQKLTSVLASLATVKFFSYLSEHSPELLKGKNLPTFDCRVWTVPSKQEVVNYLIWRNRDAVKNSISMAASELFSPKELHNKNQHDRLDMMIANGINWNQYPRFFKEGVFVGTRQKMVTLDTGVWLLIPEQHRPTDRRVIRSEVIEVLDDIPFSRVSNKIGVVFRNEPAIPFSEVNTGEE